jgi:hypothetical protein
MSHRLSILPCSSFQPYLFVLHWCVVFFRWIINMGESQKIMQVRSARQVPVRVQLLDDDTFNHSVDVRLYNIKLIYLVIYNHIDLILLRKRITECRSHIPEHTSLNCLSLINEAPFSSIIAWCYLCRNWSIEDKKIDDKLIHCNWS